MTSALTLAALADSASAKISATEAADEAASVASQVSDLTQALADTDAKAEIAKTVADAAKVVADDAAEQITNVADAVSVVEAVAAQAQASALSATQAVADVAQTAQDALDAASSAVDSGLLLAEQVSDLSTTVVASDAKATEAKVASDAATASVTTLTDAVGLVTVTANDAATAATAAQAKADAVEADLATANDSIATLTTSVEAAQSDATDAKADAAAALAATTTIANYKKELHIDPVNGVDTNVGTSGKPVKTWEKLLTLIDGSGLRVVMHPGTYPEAVTFNKLNVTIEGLVGQGALVNVEGDWSFSSSTSSVRVHGVSFTNVTQFGAGGLYMTNCAVRGTFAKTLSAYTEFKECDLAGSGVMVSAGGFTNIFRSKVVYLLVNSATAVVTALDCENLAIASCTAGVLQLGRNIVFAPDNTTPAITGAAGSTVVMQDNKVYTPSGTNARIALQGLYSVSGDQFDVSNSTLTGANLGTSSHFDALASRGGVTAGGLLSGSAFAVPWVLSNSYASGVWVDKGGKLARSNSAIPANTPYATGTTGATWFEIGASSSVVYSAYAKEIHVDPDGLDTNTGTAGRPFKTLAKAKDVYTAGMRIVLHAGTFSGDTTFDTAVDIQGLGGSILSGSLTLNHATGQSSVSGVELFNLNHSGAGSVALNEVVVSNTLPKTGSGNLLIDNSKVRRLSIQASGFTQLNNTNTSEFLSNHANAVTVIRAGEHIDGKSYFGTIYANDALLFASTSTGECFSSNVGSGLIRLDNCRGYYKDSQGNLTLARVTLLDECQILSQCYFAPDSTYAIPVQDGYTKSGDVQFDAAKVKSIAMSHEESSGYAENVLVEWDGKLIKSNSVIPPNTPVALGLGEGQWTVIADQSANSGATVTLRAETFGAIVPNAKMGDSVIVTDDGTIAGKVLETWIHTAEYWLQTSGHNYTAAVVVDNTVGDHTALKIGRSIVPATNVDSLFDGRRNNYVDYDGRTWLFTVPTNGDRVIITTGSNAGKVYTYNSANTPPWKQDVDPYEGSLAVFDYDSAKVGGYKSPCVLIDDGLMYRLDQDAAQGVPVDEQNATLLGYKAESGTVHLSADRTINSGSTTQLLSFTLPSAGRWEVRYVIDGAVTSGNTEDRFEFFIATASGNINPESVTHVYITQEANASFCNTQILEVATSGETAYTLNALRLSGSFSAYSYSTKVIFRKVGGFLPIERTGAANDGMNATITHGQTKTGTTFADVLGGGFEISGDGVFDVYYSIAAENSGSHAIAFRVVKADGTYVGKSFVHSGYGPGTTSVRIPVSKNFQITNSGTTAYKLQWAVNSATGTIFNNYAGSNTFAITDGDSLISWKKR